LFYVVNSPTARTTFCQRKAKKQVVVFWQGFGASVGVSAQQTSAYRIGSVFTEGGRLFKEGGIGVPIADDPDCN